MKRLDKMERVFYVMGVITLVLIILGVLLWKLTGINVLRLQSGCGFRQVLGIYCPGCGGSRAVVSLARGHFFRSMLYHPLVLYLFYMYVYFMGGNTVFLISKGRSRTKVMIRNRYVWIALGILIVNFVIRNVLLLGFDIKI